MNKKYFFYSILIFSTCIQARQLPKAQDLQPYNHAADWKAKVLKAFNAEPTILYGATRRILSPEEINDADRLFQGLKAFIVGHVHDHRKQFLVHNVDALSKRLRKQTEGVKRNFFEKLVMHGIDASRAVDVAYYVRECFTVADAFKTPDFDDISR